MSADPPNNSESAEEPETITDLSELSFDFEDAAPSSRRPAYGSALSEPDPSELSEELELLDSLSGQITGDGPPEFFCKPLGQLLGPMSLAELRIMAESGALAEDDLVRYGETGEWKPAASFARLAESLHRGSSITAEPVASAPPSTRRLFQTGYKPTGDSFGEDSSGSQPLTPSEPPVVTAVRPETTPTPVAETTSVTADATRSPANNSAEASDEASEAGVKSDATSESDTETQATESPRRKKPAKKSPAAKKSGLKSGKKSAGKKKAVKKRNDEDDAILNDIFSEVFADDQKTQRPAMPPAAGAPTDAAGGSAARAESPSPSPSPSPSNEAAAPKTSDTSAPE